MAHITKICKWLFAPYFFINLILKGLNIMNEKNSSEKLAVIAELNRVNGFNPEQFARNISDNDGHNARKYLDVMWRKLWFRLKYPSGKITKKIVQINEKVAIIEAKVYFDKNDPAENYVSSALAYRESDPQNGRFGNRYVEFAETAAVGRALADAGFGLQYCCDISETKETDIVDAPIESSFVADKQPNIAENQTNSNDETPVISENLSEPESETQSEIFTDSEQTSNTANQPTSKPEIPMKSDKLSAPVGLLVNTANTNKAGNSANSKAEIPDKSSETKPQPPIQQTQNNTKYDKSTSVEEICRVMSLDEAKNYVVDFGKFAGKTISQIAIEKTSNLDWYVKSYSGKDNILRAASKILLDVAANQQLAG
jgi:cytoskeletal protein RodZ